MVAGDVADWGEHLAAMVERLFGTGRTLVVAVSGGGDSVALLHQLDRIRDRLGLRLVVAHLDHALRSESRTEAAFVGLLALDLGLMCVRERRDLPAQLDAEGGNLEALAREVRYAFLGEVASAVGAAAIVTAHTQDDQAETVLMNLLRGAGPDGLTGMQVLGPAPNPDARVPLFRPLLGVERDALRAWLRAEGLAWCEDSSNADPSRQRAYLRYDLLPALESRFPGVRRRLARSATLLGDERRWIESVTEQTWDALAEPQPDGISLARSALVAQPIALQRRLLRRAFSELAPSGKPLSYEHVATALALAERGHSGQRATLPAGFFLHIEGDVLWLGRAPAASPFPPVARPLVLARAGKIESPTLTVGVEMVDRAALPERWSDLAKNVALLDAEVVRWPLTIRTLHPGERWQPLGLDGQWVSLEGWLAAHGVPSRWRGYIPLLVDASGAILWVVGKQVGHHARVRAASARLWRVVVESNAPSHTPPDVS